MFKEGECACPNPLGIRADGRCMGCFGLNPKIPKPKKEKKKEVKKDDKI